MNGDLASEFPCCVEMYSIHNVCRDVYPNSRLLGKACPSKGSTGAQEFREKRLNSERQCNTQRTFSRRYYQVMESPSAR